MRPGWRTVTPWWRLCLSLACCWMVHSGPMWRQERLNIPLGHLTGLKRQTSRWTDISWDLVILLQPTDLYGQNTSLFLSSSVLSSSSATCCLLVRLVDPHLGQDNSAPPISLQLEHTRWAWSHPYRGGLGGVWPHTTHTRNDELGPWGTEYLAFLMTRKDFNRSLPMILKDLRTLYSN